MVVLGIESSCDETAAAVVIDGKLRSNVVHSQIDLHAVYGGVVPEIAARSHIETILPVVERALRDAFQIKDESLKIKELMSQIDAIAVTQGPGLGGSLLIGTLTARTLAWQFNKKLYGVNHVAGHVFANFLETEPKFPMLALIVSGGHSQLALFRDYFDYDLLGQTRDDAVGEAFDKVAKMLGLPYPGGPQVEQLSKQGDASAFDLPKVSGLGPYEFSFSGIKTAVLRALQAEIGQGFDFPSHKLPEALDESTKANMAASFSNAVFSDIAGKMQTAIDEFAPRSVVIGGGVAASQSLREHLKETLSIEPTFIDRKLCTDNAAMIASLGYQTIVAKKDPSDPMSMKINPSLSM